MCKGNKGLWLLAVVGLLTSVVWGQTRSRARAKLTTPPPAMKPAPAKRWVIVHLRQGEPVRGTLLRADAELVQLAVPQGHLTLSTDDILRLDFVAAVPPAVPAASTVPSASTTANSTVATAEKPMPTATPEEAVQTARQIYQALRKLNDAAKLGLPYPQYANLLIETKAGVEERLARLPETALKGESALALEAYLAAGQAWNAGMATGLLPLASEPGATLHKKYEIKPSANQLGEEDHLRLDATLNTIWQRASKHLDNVAALLKQG